AEVADVLVVQIDVDEAADLALVVEDLLAEVGELRRQRGEDFADGRAGRAHGVLFPRELPQRGRDQYFGHVSRSTPLWPPRSVPCWAASYWRGRTLPCESRGPRRNTTDKSFSGPFRKSRRRNRGASGRSRSGPACARGRRDRRPANPRAAARSGRPAR